MPTDPELLLSYLHAQRRHVLGIIEGLDDEQLRRPVLPSGWTCLGMVQHLTLDDERFWFAAVMAGQPEAIAAATADDAANAWIVGPDIAAESVLSRYRSQIERSDAIVSGLSLDRAPAWWPDFFGEWRMDDLREVLLHVITETACHAGHLDAARELIDGRRWQVLP